MFKTSNAFVSNFPTKMYIMRLKESGNYYAILNTNVSSRSADSIDKLYATIKEFGFPTSSFGRGLDGVSTDKFDDHLLKESGALKFSELIDVIYLITPLDSFRNRYPEIAI